MRIQTIPVTAAFFHKNFINKLFSINEAKE
jgi:hypothetical protein